MSKPQKKCIFCESMANSKEHFYSSWMKEYLGSHEDKTYLDERAYVGSEKPSGLEFSRELPGQVWTRKLRVVCTTCNNGWMSRLENEIKGVLVSLINGTEISLTADQRSNIARWFFVKMACHEYDSDGNWVTPRGDLLKLHSEGLIPDYGIIYVSSHDCNVQTGISRVPMNVGPDTRVDRETPDNNGQLFTMLLGRTCLHFSGTTNPNQNVKRLYKYGGPIKIPELMVASTNLPTETKLSIDEVNTLALGFTPRFGIKSPLDWTPFS